MPDATSPPGATTSHHDSLPTALTSFIGREADVATLRRLSASTRLLTLTGAGGSGKTRLALEVAAAVARDDKGSAAWVDLAPLTDGDLLAAHVATALGVELGPRPAIDSLLDALRSRELLVVLDNCEHLIDDAAALVELLLQECPALRILATSREALGASGERAWLVPTLSLPDAASPPIAAVRTSAAGRLFIERAEAAHAAFALTESNAAAVGAICRRLDGLPLAIELAAARVRALSPEQIAARLDDAFRLLTSGARTAVARHRTLGGAIDWSYALLDEGERAVLHHLSVFAGSFSLEAAEFVCAPVGGDALDRVAALVDKSLVVMIEGDGTARYRLLETIRQYAAQRLRESGAEATARERHAHFFTALVRDAEPHLITAGRREWVEHVMREFDNVRGALAWSRDHDPHMHLRLAGMLCWVWYSSGLWSEGRRWLDAALLLPHTPDAPLPRAGALLAAGVLAGLQAETVRALPWLEESAAIFRSLGERQREAYALAYIGVTIGQQGSLDAVPPSHAALEIFREVGDLYGHRLALVVLVTLHTAHGHFALALAQAEEATRVARAFGAPRELGIALQVHGTVLLVSGDTARAGALIAEALAALQRDPQVLWVARALELMAIVGATRGAAAEAARFCGAAEAHRESIGAAQFRLDRERLAPCIVTARATLGDHSFATAWRAGRELPIDDAVAEAIALGQRASASPAAPDGLPLPSAATTTATEEMAAAPPSPGEAPLALDVRALGPLVILRDGAPLPLDAWKYPRARELLLYLLAHPEGRTREQIGLAFWPDASAAQVKNSFHVMLHHLRKALGRSDVITFERDRYRVAWNVGVSFDAARFEYEARTTLRALKEARNGREADPELAGALREALALYRGEFLGDEGAGDWHLESRDALRRLYVDGLVALGESASKREDYSGAAEIFRRAVAADALNEGAHRRLMRALTRSGERGEALRHYERLVALLRRELQAEPEARTTDLYDTLREGVEI